MDSSAVLGSRLSMVVWSLEAMGFSRIGKQAKVLMEREHPVPLRPRCLLQDAELHEILDERFRRCGG